MENFQLSFPVVCLIPRNIFPFFCRSMGQRRCLSSIFLERLGNITSKNGRFQAARSLPNPTANPGEGGRNAQEFSLPSPDDPIPAIIRGFGSGIANSQPTVLEKLLVSRSNPKPPPLVAGLSPGVRKPGGEEESRQLPGGITNVLWECADGE